MKFKFIPDDFYCIDIFLKLGGVAPSKNWENNLFCQIAKQANFKIEEWKKQIMETRDPLFKDLSQALADDIIFGLFEERAVLKKEIAKLKKGQYKK